MRYGPDFLIIGAAKSGTTILYHWLKMQDQVFLPEVKEPHYFCFAGMDPQSIGSHVDPVYAEQMSFHLNDYEQLFRQARSDQIKGEASPGYLYFSQSADNIYNANPAAKIICVLRDPCDRAYSQYMHHVRDGYESHECFSVALDDEERRIKEGYWWGYHYRQAGLYAGALTRYIEKFACQNVLTLLYDDIQRNPSAVFRKTTQFLGVEQSQTPDFSKTTNAASSLPRIPRFPIQANVAHRRPRLGYAMSKLGLHPAGRICGKPSPRLDPKVRKSLIEYYRDDILATSSLIGRDLSAWIASER